MKKILFLVFALIYIEISGGELPRIVSSCWDGQRFLEVSDAKKIKRKSREISDLAIYFSANHVTCYGHALLDGVFPLYCLLKEYHLLDQPIVLLINADKYTQKNKTFINIINLIKDVFKKMEVRVLEKGDLVKNLVVDEYVPFANNSFRYLSFYHSFPESFKYITSLKNVGFCDNYVFRDSNNDANIFREFVDVIKSVYKIDLPLKENRILIANRPFSRRIVNLDDLVSKMREHGYDVVVSDFEQLSVRDQIIETVKSKYLLGTYGSNLVNAVFLQPEASVVVLWHKYAKYFWSRRYCIIHSSFLSVGVKLIEYDKPQYDSRDIYMENVHVPDYFYRLNNMNVLREEKINMDAIVNYPIPAMYEITNVDLYIDPVDLIKCLDRSGF